MTSVQMKLQISLVHIYIRLKSYAYIHEIHIDMYVCIRVHMNVEIGRYINLCIHYTLPYF